MIRFGLIGCGTHSQWAVLPAMASSTKCKLVAAADIVPANLAAVPDSAVARYADYRQMLAKEKLDAVYIATPCDVHCEPTVAALEAGCHVVCEKPMGMDVAECRRMLAASKAANRLLGIDFETRYDRLTGHIRQWIADGRIGAVHAIHIDHLWSGHKNFGRLAQRRKNFLDRSGCLDCGIHMLDLSRHLAGGGEWRDIQALGGWFGEDVKLPTHISIQARLTTGTLVTVNASFAYTASINAVSQVHAFSIVGSHGVIELTKNPQGGEMLRLVSDSLSETVEDKVAGHAAVIPMLLDDFAGAIEAGLPLPSRLASGDDGLAAQEIVDEANRQACAKGDVCKKG